MKSRILNLFFVVMLLGGMLAVGGLTASAQTAVSNLQVDGVISDFAYATAEYRISFVSSGTLAGNLGDKLYVRFPAGTTPPAPGGMIEVNGQQENYTVAAQTVTIDAWDGKGVSLWLFPGSVTIRFLPGLGSGVINPAPGMYQLEVSTDADTAWATSNLYEIKDFRADVNPNRANVAGRWNIGIVPGVALTAGVDGVDIVFPSSMKLPSGISPSHVIVNGVSCGTGTGDAWMSENTLSLVVPQTVNAGSPCLIVISQSADLVNPPLSQELYYMPPPVEAVNSYLQLSADMAPDELYRVRVNTTQGESFTRQFEIFDWIEIDESEWPFGTVVVVTGAGFKPGATVHLNALTGGPMAGSSLVNDDGTIEVYGFTTAVPAFVPMQAKDGSGRTSNWIWPSHSLMIDSVWLISLLDRMNGINYEVYRPEGEFHVIPNLDVSPKSGPAGSKITLTGINWGGTISAANFTLAGQPLNLPVAVVNKTDLDNDCGTIATSQMGMNLDLELGCDDDFQVIAQVPRTMFGGKTQIAVTGGDLLNSVPVTASGTVAAGGMSIPLPIPISARASANQLSCLLNALGVKTVIASPLEPVLEWLYDVDMPDCTGGTSTATAVFNVTPRAVTVEPASAPPGGSVIITGSGFVPAEPNSYESDGIDLDGNGVTTFHGFGGVALFKYGNTTKTGTMTTNIEVDDQGNFTIVGTVPPDAPSGTHEIIVLFDPTDTAYQGATDAWGDEVSAKAMFEVGNRELMVIPSSGPYGTNITISGGNFGTIAGSGTVMLQVNNGASMSTLTLSTSGGIIPATLQVVPPALAPPAPGFSVGVNEVKATNVPNNIAAVSYFEVTRPTMTMDRDRGPRGTKVVITGGGWLPGEINFVQIQMFDPTATTPAWKTVKTATPDENGSIWASLQIPASVSVLGGAANVRFRAIDTNSNKTLETVFVVTQPAITVDPEAAAPGEMIKIIGTGFLPQAPVGSITLGGARIVRSDDLPLTDRQGGFEVMGIVPGLAPGGYAVTATVVTSVNVPFTVMATGEGDITVPVGFATIEGLYTIVWTFNAITQQWEVYDIAEGAPDDFDTLIKGQGYWLYVTEDCTLSFGQYTYNLKKGWNLIGWLG